MLILLGTLSTRPALRIEEKLNSAFGVHVCVLAPYKNRTRIEALHN